MILKTCLFLSLTCLFLSLLGGFVFLLVSLLLGEETGSQRADSPLPPVEQVTQRLETLLVRLEPGTTQQQQQHQHHPHMIRYSTILNIQTELKKLTKKPSLIYDTETKKYKEKITIAQ